MDLKKIYLRFKDEHLTKEFNVCVHRIKQNRGKHNSVQWFIHLLHIIKVIVQQRVWYRLQCN